jgi:hypothetical protein
MPLLLLGIDKNQKIDATDNCKSGWIQAAATADLIKVKDRHNEPKRGRNLRERCLWALGKRIILAQHLATGYPSAG